MKVNELNTYDHIKVVYFVRNKKDGSLFSNAAIGQFRAKITGDGKYGYDDNGKEIWITCDNGFEAFIVIEDILNIERV
jgi:hypothetical protein